MAEIVLFGASGGIGQHIVKSLGADHRIFGAYNSSDPSALHSRATYKKVDVTKKESVADFANKTIPELNHPVLIYAPGISLNSVAHKCLDKDWQQTIATNLTGAMYAVRSFLPRMRECKWGRIILVSSILADQGVPGTLAYSATKAGLCAMARVISAENAKKGITANAIALGYFEVGIIRAVPKEYLETTVIPRIPVGHLGNPDNISATVRFLIEADFVTGSVVRVNGGMDVS